jgi:hypothetical protein
MRQHLGGTLTAMAAMLIACGEPVAVVIDADDLLLSFQTTSDTLRAGGQIVATLTLVNPTADTLRFETEDGCVGRARVLRWDEAPSAFQVAGEPCADTARAVILAAGESVVKHWTITAWLRDTALGMDTLPPLPGRYSVRLDTPAPLPDLDAPFTLWPSGYWFGWRRCGFATPILTDSIVVSAELETVFGVLARPYRIHNFTSSDITFGGNWARGTINGVQFGEGWSEIVHVIERQTASGWETYGGTVMVYQHAVRLQPNECLQARNPLADIPTGTYRIRVPHRWGWAYSEPVVVP